MPRGASPKRERHFEKIKKSAQKSGRYGRRAEEVATRTVNKIRREKGEAKAQKAGAKKSTSRARTSTSRVRSGSGATRRSANGRAPSARSRSTAGGRGFASMSAARQRQIASVGGRAAHAQGTAHEFSPAEARQAGQKGGEAVSRDRRHMAAIGRKGGQR